MTEQGDYQEQDIHYRESWLMWLAWWGESVLKYWSTLRIPPVEDKDMLKVAMTFSNHILLGPSLCPNSGYDIISEHSQQWCESGHYYT